jgi:HEAT repeat protein
MCAALAGSLEAGTIVFDFATGNDAPPALAVNQTPPRTVELLIAALAEKPPTARRIELLRDLGASMRPEAVSTLVQTLSDQELSVRCAAAAALGALGEKSALAILSKASGDPEAEMRIAVLRAAGRLGDTSLSDRALQDADERVFVAACALARTGDETIVSRLTSLSVGPRCVALRTLGSHRYAPAVQVISSELKSDSVAVVVASIHALAQIGVAPAGLEIQQFLNHAHPTVRRAALDATMRLCDPATQRSAAKAALGDGDWSVRAAAVNIFAAHPDVAVLPQLLDQLPIADATLHASARRAIVSTATDDLSACIAAATRLLHDADPRRREDGSFLLGELKNDAMLDVHMKLLDDPDSRVVRQVARSLGQIGAKPAAGELIKLAARFKPGDESVALDANHISAIAEAFIACGRLGEKSALPLANKLIPEKLSTPVEIRVACIWTAGVLADAADDDTASRLITVLNDNSPFEVEQARIEAARALANQHRLASLETLRREGATHPLASLRFACHQAADALENTQTAYHPPEAPYVPDTQIQALP